MPGRPQVLIVEDNLDLAENVREFLEDEGMEVVIASRGEAALIHAKSHRVDLAIVDVRLPNTTGIELLTELRPLIPGGEVIFMTGNATLDTAIAAVREGVFAYVQKPFDPFDLVALVRRALSQVELRRERAALAHELARSEALYRGVVDTVETLIVGLDHQGRIQMWNRCAAETTGWEAGALLGADLLEHLFGEDERPMMGSWIDLAWSSRPAGLEIAVQMRRGGQRLIRWSQASVVSNGQTLLLLVGQDVTESRELERRAADAEAMASLATLTAGLAHEIRNPLNAAILQLELLSRVGSRLSDERARGRICESIRLVQAEIRRLSKLLEEFLSLARPRSFDLYPVELGAVVDQVITMHRPVAQAAGVELRAPASAGWPRVLGDQSKLTQVFVNLVVNAIDAMRGGAAGDSDGPSDRDPAVVITAKTTEEGLLVRVTDNGPGMPEEVRSNAFRPFYSTKEQGTGLGLPIVKRIIDLHRGSIAIEPGAGQGTVVEICLRLAPTHRALERGVPAEEEP